MDRVDSVGHVVVFLGVGGGMGTTSRVIRAARGGVAVDLDLATGGLSSRLSVPAPTTLADLPSATTDGVIEPRHLAAVLYQFGRRTSIVACPIEPELVELVDARTARAVVRAARQFAPIVAVDLGARFDHRTFQLCCEATEIRIVCPSTHPGHLRRAQALVDVLARGRVGCPVVVDSRLNDGVRSIRAARALGLPWSMRQPREHTPVRPLGKVPAHVGG